MHVNPPTRISQGLLLLFAALLLLSIHACHKRPTGPASRDNHDPIIDSLFATPDTIGPSDSTIVECIARDSDNDSLVYDWATSEQLNIQGNPTWNKFLNQQHSPIHKFYNADLPPPRRDSAYVLCGVRDPLGGGAERNIFIVLHR